MIQRVTYEAFRLMVICTIILAFLFTKAYSQGENNIWLFGKHLGLDFNPRPPAPGETLNVVPFNNESVQISSSRYSTQSDKSGNMIFYTNGRSIWNRNFEVMENGVDLLVGGGGIVIREVIILPKSCSQYYIFYLGNVFGPVSRLYSSVVDMEMDGGLGAIEAETKDQLIFHGTVSSITSGAGIGHNWLIGASPNGLRKYNILAFKVTPKGVEEPVITTVPVERAGGIQFQVKVSPDGNELILIQSQLLSDQLPMYTLSFDSETGVAEVKNTIYPEAPPPPDIICPECFGEPEFVSGITAAEFSPEMNFIYISERYAYCDQLDCFIGFKIFQYEYDKISREIKKETKTLLKFYKTADLPVGEMLLAPNNRIYMTRFNSAKLDAILSPDLKGVKCFYSTEEISYPEGRALIAFPNLVIPRQDMNYINDDLRYHNYICPGETRTLTVDDCYDDVIWSDGTTGNSIEIHAAGNYWVEILDGECSFKQWFTFSDHGIGQQYLPRDTFLCNEERLNIDLSSENFDELIWEDGSQNPRRVIDQKGMYWVELRKDGCAFRDSLYVNKRTLFGEYIDDEIIICPQEELELRAIEFNAEFLWSNGDTKSFTTITEPGKYWVDVIADECIASDTIIVHEFKPLDVNLGSDTTICRGTTLRLNASHPNAIAYKWSTGSTFPRIKTSDPGEYVVEIDDGTCIQTESISIETFHCVEAEIYIPNVFSPNFDGINDYFSIEFPRNIEYVGGRMRIYNRWGQLMFDGDDLEKGWDGLSDGFIAASEVYVYIIDIEVIDKFGTQELHYEGSLSLIR